MFGYCLTGSIEEHVLLFNRSTGGNGKGTALNTVTGILRDYARVSPIDTFTASHGDRHPTESAMLHGARLVTSRETEEGGRWAESRIKALTGGDAVTARFMRADCFTFAPQFKLVIAGNHRPSLRSVDEAMRRRFHLIPWDQQVSAATKDPQLPDKLRAEWPGILAWMIDGCQEWLEMGRHPPAVVQDATAEYLEAEDSFGAWMEECCARRPGQWASSAELFESWRQWAERTGERAGNAKTFADAMKTRGFIPEKSGHARTRGLAGIMLKPTSHPAAYLAS